MTQAYNLSQLANKVNTSGQLNPATGLSSQVPVANGGTGLATLTANNVILGNGTSAVQFVAPGTAGNALVSNGTTWVAGSPTLAGSLIAYQIFTASGTYTKATNNPAFIIVYVVGGGGGSSSGASPVTGGTSSFGAFCSATGGYSGSSAASRPGGSGSGGDLNVTGQSGSAGGGAAGQNILTVGGLGAFGLGYGNGANQSVTPGKSAPLSYTGGGGGGAMKRIAASSLASSETVTVGAGGTISGANTGTAGIVIVWEYQ